jgi:hypothetical protein
METTSGGMTKPDNQRPTDGPMTTRQIADTFGISRAMQWRAKQIINIPEDEFEALIESENPSTVTALVEYARGNQQPAPPSGLRRLIREWNRSTKQDQDAFLNWIGRQSTNGQK